MSFFCGTNLSSNVVFKLMSKKGATHVIRSSIEEKNISKLRTLLSVISQRQKRMLLILLVEAVFFNTSNSCMDLLATSSKLIFCTIGFFIEPKMELFSQYYSYVLEPYQSRTKSFCTHTKDHRSVPL